MEADLAIAITAGIGTATTTLGLLLGRRERRAKTKAHEASAAADIAEAFANLNDALEGRIQSLEKKELLTSQTIDGLQQDVEKLEIKVVELQREIVVLETEKETLTKENHHLRERVRVLEMRS